MARRLTGRTPHQVIRDETGWPALSSHVVSSTPAPRRKRRTQISQNTGIRLENRFAPLLQAPEGNEIHPKKNTRARYETKSSNKGQLKRLTASPQVLIVGDGAVNEIRRFCSKKNTTVLCFNKDTVSDISEKILTIAAAHPQSKSLIIHAGANDVLRQKSEILKQDFTELLNKVEHLDTEVLISGPLPTVQRGDERFSRLWMLNKWLKDTCAARAVKFIENFNIFWERWHLFKADGFCLNKSGVRLLSSNIFYFVHKTSGAPAKDKDKRRDNPKQKITTQEPLLPAARKNHGHWNQEEEAVSSSPSLQKEESTPVPTGNPQPSPLQRPPNLSSSLDPLVSPEAPILDFPDSMKRLIPDGVRLTPLLTPRYSSLNLNHHQTPPTLTRLKQPSPKKRRAPLPPGHLPKFELD